MSGSGGFGFGRSHSGDRFYSPPAMRRLHEQQQRHVKSKMVMVSEAEENRGRSGDRSAFLKPPLCSANELRQRDSTNLDRFLETITPLVPAMYLSKSRIKGLRNLSADCEPYFNLGDLWESFREWSAYGAGVPVLMNGTDSVIQYYVPYLSGIQLYIDPSKSSTRHRRPGEESDAESSRESSSDISSEYDSDGQPKNIQKNSRNQVDLNRLSLKDDDMEVSNPPGLLVYQFLEREVPHFREPLINKISSLSSRYPELNTFNSYDLLPSSWISVAWYPIYRIPMGPTLRDLDACFLTFHSLSTTHQSVSHFQPQVCAPRFRKVNGSIDSSPKLPLPVFGLASYKFKGPMWTSNGFHERQQASSLYQAADNWLRQLQVDHPDYRFFVTHNAGRR